FGVIETGRCKTKQLGDSLTVGRVYDGSFLEHQAKLQEEPLVVFWSVRRQIVQPVEDTLDQGCPDPADERVVLQGLSRDVERKVFRIDQAAEKPKVFRKQVATVALHEHSLGAEV